MTSFSMLLHCRGPGADGHTGLEAGQAGAQGGQSPQPRLPRHLRGPLRCAVLAWPDGIACCAGLPSWRSSLGLSPCPCKPCPCPLTPPRSSSTPAARLSPCAGGSASRWVGETSFPVSRRQPPFAALRGAACNSVESLPLCCGSQPMDTCATRSTCRHPPQSPQCTLPLVQVARAVIGPMVALGFRILGFN